MLQVEPKISIYRKYERQATGTVKNWASQTCTQESMGRQRVGGIGSDRGGDGMVAHSHRKIYYYKTKRFVAAEDPWWLKPLHALY